MERPLFAIAQKMTAVRRTPAWIPGLVLRADGYECEYYRKD